MRRLWPVSWTATRTRSIRWSGGTRGFRYARSLGMDAGTAADMVQDALVKAYVGLEGCRNPDCFGAWAGRILRNGCLDYLKSAARRSVPLPPSLPSHRGNPDLEEERSRLRRRLKEALAALPDEQREAFLMKHGEGLSYEEIAKLTGGSVSALKMRVHRAREALRDQLHISLSDRM